MMVSNAILKKEWKFEVTLLPVRTYFVDLLVSSGIFIFSYFLYESLAISILLLFITFIVGAMAFSFSKETLFIDDKGIHFFCRFRDKVILWEEIISVSLGRESSYSFANYWFLYHIKTVRGNITIPQTYNYESFEKALSEKGFVVVAQEEMPSIFGIRGKRWSKVGKEYEYTGLADKYFFQIFYSTKTMMCLGLVFFLLTSLIMVAMVWLK